MKLSIGTFALGCFVGVILAFGLGYVSVQRAAAQDFPPVMVQYPPGSPALPTCTTTDTRPCRNARGDVLNVDMDPRPNAIEVHLTNLPPMCDCEARYAAASGRALSMLDRAQELLDEASAAEKGRCQAAYWQGWRDGNNEAWEGESARCWETIEQVVGDEDICIVLDDVIAPLSKLQIDRADFVVPAAIEDEGEAP